MKTPHVLLFVTLAVGLVTGCKKDEGDVGQEDDDRGNAAKAFECPREENVTCEYDGDTVVVTHWDDDGNVDSRSTYTYNSAGNILAVELDSNGDGTADMARTVTYDANDDQLTEDFDWDGNGTVDQRATRSYDSNGNWLTTEIDGNPFSAPDGTIDRRCINNPPCPPEVHRDLEGLCPEPTCFNL